MPLKATEHRAVLAAGDLIAALAAIVTALWLWSIPAGWTFSFDVVRSHAGWLAAAGPWMLVAALPAAPAPTAFSLRKTAAALARGALICLLAYTAIYFYKPRVLPRLVALYFVWEAVLYTLAWRLIFIAIFSHERFRRRAVIVGSGDAAAMVLAAIRDHRPRQSRILAVVAEDAGVHPALEHLPQIGPERLPAALADASVAELIVALRQPPGEALLRTLLAGQEAGAELVRAQTLLEQLLRRVPIDLLESDWLLTDLADAVRLRGASWIAKRLLDVAGGLAGLAIAIVTFPAIAAAILLDSGRPVFYRQGRLGRGGRPFDVYKFRTMRHDAERPGEAQWAGRNDPRVTRVGRLLRRTRLDELPQFVNVVRGDMSLVGPRPERGAFVERLQAALPFYRARLMVPPGLTGWAQVNLPYGDSVDAARAKLEYDLYYVKNRSFAFDLYIVLRTFRTVLTLRGH